MGADLVGYLLRGPQRFTEEQLKAVSARFADYRSRAAAVMRAMDDGSDADDINDSIRDLPWDTEQITVDEAESSFSEATIVSFMDAWEGALRGTMTKVVGPNEQMFFTGEMTWGDSPDTEPYRACGVMDVADAFGLLGIE